MLIISFGLLGQTKHPSKMVDNLSWSDLEGIKLIKIT
jgi:hypothetical protein